MRNARHRSVRFSVREMSEDLPAELDFGKLKCIGRGLRAVELASRRKIVPLDPDVAKVFDNAEAVNEALRGLINLAKQSAGKRRKTA